MEQIKGTTDYVTGSNPVPRTIVSEPTVPFVGVGPGLILPATASETEFRPQSSPQGPSARLSRHDLRDLMAILDREIGYIGLNAAPALRALELKEKLAALHRGTGDKFYEKKT